MGQTLSTLASVLWNTSVLRDLDEKRQLQAQLLAFRSANGSNSTSQSRSMADLTVPIRGVTAKSLVLECCQMREIPIIDNEVRSRMKAKVTAKFRPTLGEVRGIHPRHYQQLEAILHELTAQFPDRKIYRGSKLIEIPSKLPVKVCTIPDFAMGYESDSYLTLLVDEVKPPKKHELGIRQAISYAVTILLHRLEASRNCTKDLTIYCVATDSEVLAVGKVAIVKGKVKVSASLERRHCLDLETEGIDALFSLFSASDTQLGLYREDAAIIDGHTVTRVLGLGGFSTVYQCRAPSGEVFVLKALPYVHKVASSLAEVDVYKKHITNEFDVLCALHNGEACANLPRLSPFQSPHKLWVGFQDTVHRLADFLQQLRDDEKDLFQDVLHRDIRAAVTHVHRCGYSHNDLRPDNVGVKMVDGRAVVMLLDFGLASSLVRSVFHGFCGGIAYFHDDIVLAMDQDEPPQVPVSASHDFAAASYVCYAVREYSKKSAQMQVPWRKSSGSLLVRERAETMAQASFDVWAY